MRVSFPGNNTSNRDRRCWLRYNRKTSCYLIINIKVYLSAINNGNIRHVATSSLILNIP